MAIGNDMRAHDETYGGFLGLLKFGMAAIALVTALVIYLIA